jgi:hypothetical protein
MCRLTAHAFAPAGLPFAGNDVLVRILGPPGGWHPRRPGVAACRLVQRRPISVVFHGNADRRLCLAQAQTARAARRPRGGAAPQDPPRAEKVAPGARRSPTRVRERLGWARHRGTWPDTFAPARLPDIRLRAGGESLFVHGGHAYALDGAEKTRGGAHT